MSIVVGRAANKGGTKSGAAQTKQTHKSSEKSQKSNRGDFNSEETDIKESVLKLMETTCRSEAEVCSALHYCDNDLQKACDMLLEESTLNTGQWQTNEKKKKKVSGPASSPNIPTAEKETDDWGSGEKGAGGPPVSGTNATPNAREQRGSSRGRSTGRTYKGRGGADNVNPSAMPTVMGEDGENIFRGVGSRRGPMGRGGGRGGGRGAGRGGRGSRPPRAPRQNQSDDCWNSNAGQNSQNDVWGDTFPSPDDWDNEEWSGHTKVFTPSSIAAVDNSVSKITDICPTAQINSASDHMSSAANIQPDSSDFADQSASLGVEASATPPSSIPSRITQDPAIYAYTNNTHHIPKPQSPNVSGMLSAAQSQYLSQLAQKSESMKQDQRTSMMNQQVYNSNYGVYGVTDLNSQRKPVQRARVPPPSKIPASAVEMPGDLGCSVGLLDVQFGALDFGSESNTFLTDGVTSSTSTSAASTDKYTASNAVEHLSDNTNVGSSAQQSGMDSHQSATNSSLANDVSGYSLNTSRSQMLTSDALSSVMPGEQSVTVTSSQYGSGVSRSVPPSVSSHVPLTVTGLESQLTGKSSTVSDVTSQQSTYSTYPGQVTGYNVSQSTKQYHPQHYPGNPYSQVNSSNTSFTSASSIASVSAYPPSNTLNQYQHVAHTQPLNTYQNSSIYAGTGIYTASGVPYNNYQTLQNSSNKLSSNVKDSQYDAPVTSSNSNLSNSQSVQSSQTSTSKLSTTSGKSSVSSSSSSSVMNSGTAGTGAGHVSAVMGQYIMGQHFYAQQPLPAYTFEDMQLIQRVPHIPYYEMSYNSGGTGAGTGTRDPSLASFASLGTGTPDTRFGRADAPSPQAVAGGGAGAGAGAAQPPQASLPPYHTYYAYGGGIMPAGSYQPYSATPLYPIATAGGTGSSSYGTGKGVSGGGAYVGGAGGGYGTPAPSSAPPPQPYESAVQQQPTQQMNSHQQDYKSGGGYSSSQQQSGLKQGVSNSGSNSGADLNNSIYGTKGHVALGKVNSYEKAYHNATPPPPFGLSAVTGGVAGVGGGGYGPPLYIPPTMPPQPQQHQIDGRVSNNHRRDNGTNNSRGGATVQNKQAGGAKQGYSQQYWNAN